MFVFGLFPVLHPSRSVRACNLGKLARSLVCFLSWFLDFLISIASLPGLIFLLSSYFGCVIFSTSISRFSTSSRYFRLVYFFRVVCGLLGFCGDFYSVPHLSDSYVPGPPFLCFVWGVEVFQLPCVLIFECSISRVTSLTPECLEAVLRHGLHCIVAMS